MTEYRTGWGRVVRYVVLTGLGVLFLFITVVTGMLPQFLSYLWPSVYYTEVFADVTAEGQRYQFSSVAKCRVYYKARWGGLIGGDTPKVITGGLMAKRLPSGAGLIVIGPALCSDADLYKFIHKEKFASPYDVRTVDLQKYLDFRGSGYTPKVMRLDDAEDPSLITAYWREYVTREDADIQVHGIRYRRLEHTPSTRPEKPEREVPWLKGRKAPEKAACEPNPATWVGFFAYTAREEVWSEVESLQYIGKLEIIKEIDWPDIINMYDRPVQNIEIDKLNKEIKLSITDYNNIGYYNMHNIESLNGMTSYANYGLSIGGEKTKPPIAAFFDPYFDAVRALGKRTFSKDAICR